MAHTNHRASQYPSMDQARDQVIDQASADQYAVDQSGANPAAVMNQQAVDSRQPPEFFQFHNISIFRLRDGRVLGFHNENLEVAQLSAELWAELVLNHEGEAHKELQSWSQTRNYLQSNPAKGDGRASSSSSVASSSRARNSPKVLTLNATQLCNLRCTYCAAGGDGTYGSPVVKLDLNKALPQLEWLMGRCDQYADFEIRFIGGEPLLYPDVLRAVCSQAERLAQAHQIHVRFSVVTNGTRLLNPEVLQVLQDFRLSVTVSVDGGPEVQNRFRPMAGGRPSSSVVEQGIRALQTIKNQLPSVGLAAVFHGDHLAVLETYRYFSNWDFDFFDLSFSHTHFERESSAIFISEMEKVAQTAYEEKGEVGLRQINFFNGLFQQLDEQARVENYCGAGKTTFSMDAQGGLYACPWDINQKELSLKNRASALEPLRFEGWSEEDPIHKPDCTQCWARFVCGGGCSFTHKTRTGSRLKVDPDFCYRTRSLIAMGLEYYEQCRGGQGYETYSDLPKAGKQ